LELISNGKTVRYRPFTVKEEKILLVAQLSNDHKQVNEAIKQVVTNCVVDLNFDVDSLATFDVEYFFINLRSKSVNNVVDIYLKDLEDEKQYNFKVNLDDIKIVRKPNHDKKIHLYDELGVVMKYPNYTIGAEMFVKDGSIDDVTALLEMIAKCIDTIYDGDKIYTAGEDFDSVEAITFVNDLPIEAVDKFKDFFDTFPEIEYVINYTNSLGNERSYKLSGINDFFT
jgi:hypothetical protein